MILSHKRLYDKTNTPAKKSGGGICFVAKLLGID